MFNLRNRNFLRLEDFTADEIRYLITLSAELKAAKYAGTEQPRLSGKNFVLLFEKDSTRTRSGFEVAAYDQGAHVTFVGPTGSHLGHKESAKDTARVLGRIYDGIEYRGFGQEIVDTFARYAGVPVWNGLTDQSHPTQVLADVLTMREHCDKPLNRISVCFLGDAEDNVSTSLMVGAAKLGMDMRLAAPKPCWPAQAVIDAANAEAARSGGKLTITEDVTAAVVGCDFLYTDVWVSMGEPDDRWRERIALLRPYQVNAAVMAATGNPKTRFLHCLPAFHDTATSVGRDIKAKYDLDAMEVTDDVFESEASIVFDQAENRMHTIKAVLVATVG